MIKNFYQLLKQVPTHSGLPKYSYESLNKYSCSATST